MNGAGETRGEMNLFSSITTTHNIPVYILYIEYALTVASGYDRLETIAHMNVSESDEPNDVDGILDYVRKNFPNDARLVS